MATAKRTDTTAARRSGGGSSPARRERLVLAAVAEIDANGPEPAVAAIAERAGVPRPHVYRIFASRDELDEAVVAYTAAELLDRLTPPPGSQGAVNEMVHDRIASAVGWAAEHPNLYRFLALRTQTLTMQNARAGLLGAIVDTVVGLVGEDALDRGLLERVLAGLIAMVDTGIVWWLEHADETREEVIVRLTRQAQAVLLDLVAQLGLPLQPDTELSIRLLSER
ncbi:TetR/AcrR family transcriptional regulator [Nocardioides sp.]|uniref:TetR/AcrR family transcriptional regulator n=1 Tax=Nocardioides sp. TaxID=35761 RepID=UPI0039E66F14